MHSRSGGRGVGESDRDSPLINCSHVYVSNIDPIAINRAQFESSPVWPHRRRPPGGSAPGRFLRPRGLRGIVPRPPMQAGQGGRPSAGRQARLAAGWVGW
jgi:hypothetical protein